MADMTDHHRLTGDSRRLTRVLADHHLTRFIGEVPCVVGSPPYNVGYKYNNDYTDLVPWHMYNASARLWAREIYDVLCPGGRAWVVVSPTVLRFVNEKDRVNLAHLWMSALSAAGLGYRDTITWRQDSWDGGCAWGSWCRPSAPNLRGSSELVLCYYKVRWDRPTPAEAKTRDFGGAKPGQLPREELGGDWGNDLCRNVWSIQPVQGKGAPFPVELPARAIRLSTWPGEWVLDPWGGTGATARAAAELGRSSVLVDVQEPQPI